MFVLFPCSDAFYESTFRIIIVDTATLYKYILYDDIYAEINIYKKLKLMQKPFSII